MNGVAVSWRTARLTWADVDLLRPGHWLNDSVLGFWQEFLSSAPPPEGFGGREELLFIDPAAACCISSETDPEDLHDMLEPLELPKRSLVLVPVSDRTDRGSGSGSHWSLLALRAEPRQAEYYDSLGTGNLASATRIAENMSTMFPGLSTVRVCEAGKQDNSHDCGVFVALFAEALCRGSSPAAVTPADAVRWRTAVRVKVLDLSQ